MVRIKTRIFSLFRAFIERRRMLSQWLFDPYRPERHYMRGPGPRWHQKYNAPPV